MQSAVFLAEILVCSPRKLYIYIIYKNIFWIKVSKKYVYLVLKKEALDAIGKHTFIVENHSLVDGHLDRTNMYVFKMKSDTYPGDASLTHHMFLPPRMHRWFEL